MNRRSFLFGAGASLIAAPAIVHAASLMPVRGIVMPMVQTLGLDLGSGDFYVRAFAKRAIPAARWQIVEMARCGSNVRCYLDGHLTKSSEMPMSIAAPLSIEGDYLLSDVLILGPSGPLLELS